MGTLLLAFALIYFEPKLKLIKNVSAVVWAYVLGLLLGNLGLEIPKEIKTLTEVSVVLSLPLLLFSNNPLSAFKQGGKVLSSFLLGTLAVFVVTILVALIFASEIENAGSIAGMLVGVYTGGTPNMAAIGLSLNVPDEQFIALNLLDTIYCAIYLLFVLLLADKLYPLFLRKTVIEKGPESDLAKERWSVARAIKSMLLAVVIVVAVLLFFFSVYGNLSKGTAVIISVTVLSLMAALNKTVNTWQESQKLGEFFVLCFCLSLGMQSKFSEVVNAGSALSLMVAVVIVATIVLHLLLSKIFKIPHHQVIISSIAALFGPAFVALISTRLNNDKLLAPGLAVGIIGFAIANFLGVFVAKILNNFLL